MGAIVRRTLLELLLLLRVLLFIRGGDDAPAPPPGDTRTEPNTNPLLGREAGAVHDDIDVVDLLALAGNQSTCVRLLQRVVLEDGQADGGSPLNERVVGVEVEQVAVATSGRDAEDVL